MKGSVAAWLEPRLFAHAWWRLGRHRRAEAEDVAQEATLVVLERYVPSSAPGCGVLLMGRGVVRNMVLHSYRDDANHSRLLAKNAVDVKPLPELDPESVQVFRQAVEDLTPREREAFVLVDVHGHSIGDAARIMGGLEPAGVAVLVSRAKRKITDAVLEARTVRGGAR